MLGGGGGCSGRRLGFSQGKSRESLGSRGVEDIQRLGQGLHGRIQRGTREEDIPCPSTYLHPPLPNPLHGSDSGRESGNKLMNCNCAWRKREMKPVPWADRADDFPPQVSSHRKVVKVPLTFNLSRWKRLHAQQVKDAAQFLFKSWHLAVSKTK